VVASGSGSPCLDLRRVSDMVADATVGADLVVGQLWLPWGPPSLIQT
jgi:hypothetical protein